MPVTARPLISSESPLDPAGLSLTESRIRVNTILPPTQRGNGSWKDQSDPRRDLRVKAGGTNDAKPCHGPASLFHPYHRHSQVRCSPVTRSSHNRTAARPRVNLGGATSRHDGVSLPRTLPNFSCPYMPPTGNVMGFVFHSWLVWLGCWCRCRRHRRRPCRGRPHNPPCPRQRSPKC